MNKLLIIVFLGLSVSNGFSQTEDVISDLLPLLLDNGFNSDYPTSDSSYWAEFPPKTQLDSLQFNSKTEWEYLSKRGFIIYDSLIGLSPKKKLRLSEKIEFKEERVIDVYSKFLTNCEKTKGFDIKQIVDNKKYFTFSSFKEKYNIRSQNGIVFFSPIVFNENQTFACFIYVGHWQGHDFANLIIAEKGFKKWRIYELRNFYPLG